MAKVKKESNEGFIEIEDKSRYLNENYPFQNVPGLSEKRRCIHCDEIINVRDYKVYRDKRGNEFIVCPNSLECDGSVIDWIRC